MASSTAQQISSLYMSAVALQSSGLLVMKESVQAKQGMTWSVMPFPIKPANGQRTARRIARHTLGKKGMWPSVHV